MEEIIEKKEKVEKKFDNASFKERFQFEVRVNDFIICQRYFKINNFNPAKLNSEEFAMVMDGYRGPQQENYEYFGGKPGIVQMIQRDLESKSRKYLWITQETRTQLTGFAKDSEGKPLVEPTYVETPIKEWDENEFIKPWECTFMFRFLIDEKPVYVRIWDGSQYPKFIRNSVDLTNSKSSYPLAQYINNGRPDLVVEIIKRICEATSTHNTPEGTEVETETITKTVVYNNDESFKNNSKDTSVDSKTYRYVNYNKSYIDGWRDYCYKKYGNYQYWF